MQRVQEGYVPAKGRRDTRLAKDVHGEACIFLLARADGKEEGTMGSSEGNSLLGAFLLDACALRGEDASGRQHERCIDGNERDNLFKGGAAVSGQGGSWGAPCARPGSRGSGSQRASGPWTRWGQRQGRGGKSGR